MSRRGLTKVESEEEMDKIFAEMNSDDSVDDTVFVTSDIEENSDIELEFESHDEELFDNEPLANTSNDPCNLDWSRNIQLQPRISFSGNEGFQNESINDKSTPADIFFRFIDDNVLRIMVVETNRYAHQLLQSRVTTRKHQLARWKDVDKNEMKRFLGVVLFMGIVNLPKIECYWKQDILYYHPLLHKINMSYNRFSLILRCWHFTDNSVPRENNDRLYKISPLIEAIVSNIQSLYMPGQVVAIDESMILFRGRLQYNPGKAHKYGVKLYKLCSPEGFVWNLKIYCGKDQTMENLDKPGSVVVSLGKKLLNEGRVFITDNWYTSIPLAMYLKSHGTDLCGTLRRNKKYLPKEVINSKLNKGELFGMQADGITVLKWRDKRDVLMLSTYQGSEMIDVPNKQGSVVKSKPKIIVEYNKGKQGIDISDQMTSYYSVLRKSLIWYKKVALEVICGYVVTNSCIMYNESHPNKTLRQLEFLEQLVRHILDTENVPTPSRQTGTSQEHFLEEIPRRTNGMIRRKRCHYCYIRNKNDRDSEFASKRTKQVSTECNACEKAFCLQCFKENH
ncbi:piggyBac transposable element-derived protein 4-like [Coccinella septempunctata]|uniref:piggyBac transposable element-derived protein 4-like n=1 Tax=Coccinella septempunctata TaxID=41139 RepID=UPI001D07D2E7|nr:piggyBac transposable element-derived protein 4-like [Coccinella septempunctata]